MRRHIAFILFLAVILSSCSIEKRIYQPGYFISGRSSSPREEKIHKKLQPKISSEPNTVIADVASPQVLTNQDTLVVNQIEKLPIIKPSSKIDILVQETPNPLKINTDSLPDEIKLLTEQSAKTRKLKHVFLISASIPLTISFIGLLTALVLFLPYAYDTFSNKTDEKIIKFVLICLRAVFLAIPLLIVYLILSIIAKKQRKKLRKMGAMNE
jgi:hypothetical protein